jgi:hypothetical protein
MGTTVRFPSLGKSGEFGYLLHSSVFEYDHFRRSEPYHCIAPWAGFYQTYGDGMVQHSPDCCAPVAMMGDYLASLATFCLDPRNEDALEVMAQHWRSLDLHNERTKRPNILRARAVRFKDDGKRATSGHTTTSRSRRPIPSGMTAAGTRWSSG